MSKITTIPFAGFYNSIWSDGIDRAEEMYLENLEQEDGVKIEASSDAIWRAADYGAMHNYVARKYVDYLNDSIKDEFDLDLDLKFESMQSPREYNFETDRIFCYISDENLRKLRSFVPEDELRLAIKTRFTSRSGFISSYPNNLDDWDADPTTWDHNEIGTLFVALLGESGDWEMDILGQMHEEFDRAFQEGVDWAKFDEFLKEEA
jgi:hypothetical protein